jgi:hypothetical protein
MYDEITLKLQSEDAGTARERHLGSEAKDQG